MKYKFWSEEEVSHLRYLYKQSFTTKEIGNLLGRTKASVSTKAMLLGLKKDPEVRKAYHKAYWKKYYQKNKDKIKAYQCIPEHKRKALIRYQSISLGTIPKGYERHHFKPYSKDDFVIIPKWMHVIEHKKGWKNHVID